MSDADDRALETLLADGEQAWSRIKEGGRRTWLDWIKIGEAYQALVNKVLNANGLNSPNGKQWARAFSPELRARQWLNQIPKGDRSKLYSIMEDRHDIERWLETLPLEQRVTLNHPGSVLRKWKAEHGPDEREVKGPTKLELQQAANLELQDQLDAIRNALDVETTEEAVAAVTLLVEDGTTVNRNPELEAKIDELERERDKSDKTLDGALDAIKRHVTQNEKQAGRIKELEAENAELKRRLEVHEGVKKLHTEGFIERVPGQPDDLPSNEVRYRVTEAGVAAAEAEPADPKAENIGKLYDTLAARKRTSKSEMSERVHKRVRVVLANDSSLALKPDAVLEMVRGAGLKVTLAIVRRAIARVQGASPKEMTEEGPVIAL
jgi:hypothetical protein